MEKLKFGKTETRNLLNMLQSPDTGNADIALQAIENADLTNFIGELIVLYKYSHLSQHDWEIKAPNAWAVLSPYFTDKSIMSSGRCVDVMTKNQASKESIELYLELFTVQMMGFLEQLGFPANSFNVSIELKDE